MTENNDRFREAVRQQYEAIERKMREAGLLGPVVEVWNEFVPEGELPARAWLVPGLLLTGYVTMLVGAPDQGKSLLCIAWALCVASGRGWGNFRPTRAGKVVICLAEEDRMEQERRFRAAAQAMGIRIEDCQHNLVRFQLRPDKPLFSLDPDTKG